MKNVHKMISMLLVVAMLLSVSAAVLAVDISMSDDMNLTGMSVASVTQAVKNYFEERADYLLGNTTAMDWLVVGIANDESVHLTQYNAKGIALQETVYTIESVECYDVYAEVDAVETISYTKNGIAATEDVFHSLTLYLDEANTPVVAADGYMELCSDFESCSYVAPSAQMRIMASDAGSALCIVEIAKAELGTTETGDDYTKYGEWYGMNPAPWCAIFVSWCANQANVDTSVIKKAAYCPYMKNFFINQGNFYYSQNYGGTYTPQPGDILFTGSTINSAAHVGIVEKVEDGKVWVYDGNWSNKVSHHAYNLSASNIVGYGNPAYESSGHVYSAYMSDAEKHWQECTNCGVVRFETEHILTDTGITEGCNRLYECTICDYTASEANHTMGTTYASDESCHWQECTLCGCESEKSIHVKGTVYYYDATYHWNACRICGATVEKIEHVLLLNANGNYECKTCDCAIFSPGLLRMRSAMEE